MPQQCSAYQVPPQGHTSPRARQARFAFTQRFSWAMSVYTPGLP